MTVRDPHPRPARDALDGAFTGPFSDLRRRIHLTIRYHGWRTLLFRALTLPLRFTPLRTRLMLRSQGRDAQLHRARSWYRAEGRPVDIVIPSYRDAEHVRALVRSIRRTVRRRGMARVIVADDCSGEQHLSELERIRGIAKIVRGERNAGYAANANRGIAVADPERDVVVLNSDVQVRPHWLACLQYAAHAHEGGAGIVGAQLLYPDGKIQFGGSVRNRDEPQWFDHRYRFKPPDWGPAATPSYALAVTGACMYVRRDTLQRIGAFDERYAMAYEDVDWCLRAWEAGIPVLYFPSARMLHRESVTRGTELGERERVSQDTFWERWADFFDARTVAAGGGAAHDPGAPASAGPAAPATVPPSPRDPLRIVYVTEDTGVGGGHRDIFEHLNRLAARGHEAALYTLGGPPDWFPLSVPVHSFEDYRELGDALAELDAIKVATWWMTAGPVWRASIPRGLPVYFVQDIETSYYPDHEYARHAVLDSYRPEFRYMTISSWNRERLRELDIDAELIPPGIDLETFRPRTDVARREDMVLALGRTNPLKNLPLTLAAWRSLAEPRPELCLFGIEPELGGAGVRYVELPSDEQVNELFCEATVFVQTSMHEGFALPPLEAMAAGAAVVCTDAHGNRDFCVDGVNCLMPEPTTQAVAGALRRLLEDRELRSQLGRAGMQTAQDYAWERRIDALEDFFERVAGSRRMALGGEIAATPMDVAARR